MERQEEPCMSGDQPNVEHAMLDQPPSGAMAPPKQPQRLSQQQLQTVFDDPGCSPAIKSWLQELVTHGSGTLEQLLAAPDGLRTLASLTLEDLRMDPLPEGLSSEDDGTQSGWFLPAHGLGLYMDSVTSQDIMSVMAEIELGDSDSVATASGSDEGVAHGSNPPAQQQAGSSVTHGSSSASSTTSASGECPAAPSPSSGVSGLSLKAWQPQAQVSTKSHIASSQGASRPYSNPAGSQQEMRQQQEEQQTLQQNRQQTLQARYHAAALRLLQQSGLLTDTGSNGNVDAATQHSTQNLASFMWRQDKAIQQLLTALRLPGSDLAPVGVAILNGRTDALVGKQAGVAKAVLQLKLKFLTLYQKLALLPSSEAGLAQLCGSGAGVGTAVGTGATEVAAGGGASGSKESGGVLDGLPQGGAPQVLQPWELLLNEFDAALRENVNMMWCMLHYLAPWPEREDKESLAEYAGMTIKQVTDKISNWRARTWKPYVMAKGEDLRSKP